MARSRLTQAQRDLIASMVEAISASPKGSEFVEGRGWGILRGPLYDGVMALADPDDGECEYAAEDLR